MNVQQVNDALEQAERERAEKLCLMGHELEQVMSGFAAAFMTAARDFGEGLRPLAEKGARLEVELKRHQ